TGEGEAYTVQRQCRAALDNLRKESREPVAKRVRVGNNMLAVKRATDSRHPEKYSGQSQEQPAQAYINPFDHFTVCVKTPNIRPGWPA
ncbi:hypothetical protein MMC07_009741, partial [Pseudocyphellaria aurata]|nr:hypothetical protein [Pseudocyphellaria aurata]